MLRSAPHFYLGTQEWDSGRGVTEQQLIRISNAVSGTFRLSLDGVVTASIPHNAVATRIVSALTALPNVAGSVEVVKEQEASAATTGGASTVSVWRVAFVSNVGDLPLMTVQVGKTRVNDCIDERKHLSEDRAAIAYHYRQRTDPATLRFDV